MKLYIDDITPRELLGLLMRLPRLLFDAIEEEWFWYTKLYKYELSGGDWQQDHDEGIAESFKRIHKHSHQNTRKRRREQNA